MRLQWGRRERFFRCVPSQGVLSPHRFAPTSHRTRLNCWPLAFCAALTIIVLIVGTAAASDLAVHRLKTYGIFEATEQGGVIYLNGKEITLRKGQETRLEVPGYNPLDGVTPTFLEIVVSITNRGRKDAIGVETRIAMSPRVAPLILMKGVPEPGHSTLDTEATRRAAVWFAPIFLVRTVIPRIAAGETVDVIFDKIDLRATIHDYAKRRLWPTELRIEASIEPTAEERNLRNNNRLRDFRIEFPTY